MYERGSDYVWCSSVDCPYKDCDSSVARIADKAGLFTFANISGQCKRYAAWLGQNRTKTNDTNRN